MFDVASLPLSWSVFTFSKFSEFLRELKDPSEEETRNDLWEFGSMTYIRLLLLFIDISSGTPASTRTKIR